MNYRCTLRSLRVVARWLLPATALSVVFPVSTISLRAADAGGSGSVAGAVTSTSTRNALQGATVTIPRLNRTVLTDEAGRFLISDVPAGVTELVVSYAGFNDERTQINVSPGAAAQVDLQLQSSDVITMEKFTVASVKEGQALSITEQRNAPNVKNVVAFDEWGILPTQNVGELVSRLPGMSYTVDEDNLIMNVSIRGQPPGYTRLNIDGMSSTGVGGDGRTATLHSFSGSQYEQVEIIAGQTPDKRADSLGGQLNLKTRSPLAMRENRRITYGLGGRLFPSWSDRNFAVSERPLRGDANFSWTEVLSVGGGHRNLGLVVSGAYQRIINGHDWDSVLYEATTNPVAQPRDYSRWSGFNDRFIRAFSARADYRLSPSTLISLRFLYNGGAEPFFNYTQMNPWISANITVNDPVTNPNGAIRPGYTQRRIEFLPVATTVVGTPVGATQMKMSQRKFSFTSKNPTGTLAFEHNWGRLKVDHAYRWSNTHWDLGAGEQREGGQLDLRTKDPIGFIFDYSNPRGKTITWTGGADPYNIASYTPFVTAAASASTPAQTSGIFIKRDIVTDTNEVSANVHASYLLPTELPITFKTGLDTVNRRVNNRQVYPRRWFQVPGTVLPTTLQMPLTEFERQNSDGRRMPVLDPAFISTTLTNPALWTEDLNYTATQQLTNRRLLEEGVDAAYVQGTAKLFNRLTVLTGVRGEWVTTDTFTYFRARTTAVAAEPDHFKRAALDYNKLSRDGKYHKYFPSVHLAYDVTQNLKARASWSNSYGRPFLGNLIAAASANDTQRTVTIGNPELKPQVAKNIDVKLEYYYSDSGMITATVYEKKIDDYIGGSRRSGEVVGKGPDNGFDGLYEEYEIIQPNNLGSAEVRGLEVDVRQRLSFLPGVLKGLTVRGNMTHLRTKGKFAGTIEVKNGQIADYVPRAWNAGLMYNYKKWGATYDVNYTASYPLVVGVAATGGFTTGSYFRRPLTVMNASLTYRVHPAATLYLSMYNIEQEGQERFTYQADRTRSVYVVPRSIKFGVNGQF
ncbi:MAG: TonB-dependent receptor [Opitutaceae bacterium]|nr:TonB-dependent receptor [Opitutaceae bacterium]